MKATARIQSPDATLPYLEAPDIENCPRIVFWVHHWMRDTAETDNG